MAKFDFNNSRYAKFFSSKENTRFLQTFLDRTDIFFTNYGWYKTQGSKDPDTTPTAADGTATLTVKAKKLESAPMMDLRVPLGDSNQMDTQGLKWYTTSIPDFIAHGFTEKATEREYRRRQFELFGNDADIVEAWTDKVQSQMDSLDATMTWLTAQLMTTAKNDYTGIGRGIQAPLQKVPDVTVGTCGEKAFTDPDCDILDEMRLIEFKYREARGHYGGPLVWQFTRKFYQDYFLRNKSVKDFVQSYRTLNYKASTKQIPVLDSEWQAAKVDCQGISPIELVEERERNKTNTTDTFVNGWSNDIAVLRPTGDAVKFAHKDFLDRTMQENYGSDFIKAVFGTTNDGLGLLMNSTIQNGRYKEWHTDLMLAAIPVLIDFPNHEIIDVTKADK